MKRLNHVAMILDGNRRWAKAQGLNPIKGHRQGAHQIEHIIKHIHSRGIHTVTIWVFSTENWKRDKIQVQGLMSLFMEFAENYFERALAEKTRIVHLGRKDRIPEKLRKTIKKYEDATKHFKDRLLNIALDYGGRDDIMRGVRKIVEAKTVAEDITEKSFNDFLDTSGQPHPNPDIIIRTGGERRMSGFMIWQTVYAEYFFPKKFLPDMTTDDIDDILDSYIDRDRRFGK